MPNTSSDLDIVPGNGHVTLAYVAAGSTFMKWRGFVLKSAILLVQIVEYTWLSSFYGPNIPFYLSKNCKTIKHFNFFTHEFKLMIFLYLEDDNKFLIFLVLPVYMPSH